MAEKKSNRIVKRGQNLAEYTLVLALIALACIGVLTLMGDTLDAFLNDFAGTVGGIMGG